MIKIIKRFALLIPFIIIGIIVVYFQFKQEVVPIIAPTPTPEPTPIPFEFVSVFPRQGEQEMGNPGIALQFQFSKQIDVESAVITISPFVNVNTAPDITKKTLYISPKQEWAYNVQYELEISEIKSIEGETLSEPIKYDFKFTSPTDSPLTEHEMFL